MMQYRRFGRTELQIPLFPAAVRYQFKWQDVPRWLIPGQSGESRSYPGYRSWHQPHWNCRGYGTSEMSWDRFCPLSPRSTDCPDQPQQNPREFHHKFEQSLANLRLDYVDPLGLHGINNAETLHHSIRAGGCSALKLQAQGKVRFIGFSTHGPDRYCPSDRNQPVWLR